MSDGWTENGCKIVWGRESEGKGAQGRELMKGKDITVDLWNQGTTEDKEKLRSVF